MPVTIECEEPFGIVFAGSLACGTPVISTPRGALPEIVRQGVDGYLYDSLDGLCRSIGQVGLIERENCRKRVEESFSSHVIVDKYLDLYKSLLHG